MKYLKGNEEKKAIEYLMKALEIGLNSTCQRAKCGSIIVKDDEIIGIGFNSPPKNIEKQRRCSFSKDSYHKKITDKTCCVHAEQRAIIDALKRNPDKISNSKIYFIRIDEDNKPVRAGNPYCTICSKMALDTGIKQFILWKEEGVAVYETEEYNLISFEFKN
jgi:deoxycytidylate deaminase